MLKSWRVNLQQFAEDAGAVGGMDSASQSIGSESQGAVSADAPVQDYAASFDSILQDEGMRAEYEKRMSTAVKSRHKDYKDLKQRDSDSDELYAFVAGQYGIVAGEDGKFDRSAIMQAIRDDDTALEQEAMERNLTVSQLKSIKAIERENAALRQAEQERQEEENQRAWYENMTQQEHALRQKFPNLDMQAEMNNPAFFDLLVKGNSLEDAYYLVHKDDIIGNAMQYTADRTQSKVSASVKANRSRPSENGASSQLPSSSEFNPNSLTRADRAALRERVYRGEQIII